MIEKDENITSKFTITDISCKKNQKTSINMYSFLCWAFFWKNNIYPYSCL